MLFISVLAREAWPKELARVSFTHAAKADYYSVYASQASAHAAEI